MASEGGSPKRELTPSASAPISSIPQKRALDEGHSPAIPSPLNPDVKSDNLHPHSSSHPPEDVSQAGRSKSSRTKKDTLKKREAKAGDGVPPTPDPKTASTSKEQPALNGSSGPLRYKLAPPKPSDFDAPRGPVMTPHHHVSGPDGETIEFMETSDHVSNKKNFRYTHCIADPLFPSIIYYRQTEPEPFGPRMSFEDAATHVFFDRSGRCVTTDKGFRMARANVAVREGRWYWECKITQGIRPPPAAANNNNGGGGGGGGSEASKPDGGRHVRMGWARREASLDAPVGFDAYSYGIRDVSGEKVFMSRPSALFPPGEGIREGDVIGLEIQLPSVHLHRKIMAGQYNPAVDAQHDETAEQQQLPHIIHAEAPNIVRDRVPIRFKAHTYFEKIEYHPSKELEDLMNPSGAAAGGSAGAAAPSPTHPTPALRTLPHSHIKIYKNGALMGTAFEDLLGFLPPASKPMPQVGAREGQDDGMLGYYPAVSVFRGGAVEVNFGPDFWYPPPDYDSTNGEVDMIRTDDARTNTLCAVSERYQYQIAEDIVYDIIDEVDFWMQDGGGATGGSAVEEKRQKVGMAPGREEIKELVQDDWGE